MGQIDTIVAIALDLTAAMSAEDRYQRLLTSLRRVIPYDASALLRLDGNDLVPIVSAGLSEDAMGRRFALKEHPRLGIICRSEQPVLFPTDSALPDPFDGLLLVGDGGEFKHIHACLGCPLRVGDELIGALTAGALAAAEMRTTLLLEMIERSAERQGLIARDLMRDVQLRRGSDILGTTGVIQRLRKDISLVARSDFTVMIMGESGTGKELVARAVHAESARHNEPILYVNCAALPESLADSELFGHVRGAFTGAVTDRPGKFEVANGGTLFLDEIGELPLSVQPKLLRVLQEGEIQRVGSDKYITADVRVIVATNRDLEEEVKAGRFRADLYHRLNVYPLRVPALRERVDDIPLLAGYFCDVTRARLGVGPIRLTPEAVTALRRYTWPGNVRELENVLSRAALKAAAGTPRGNPVMVTAPHLGLDFAAVSEDDAEGLSGRGAEAVSASLGLREATRDFQRAMIQRALAENDGNWAGAARALGMHRSNLHHLATRLGLK